MTQQQAKQINAYLMLSSAFWHVISDTPAALAIIDFRGAVALDMDGDTLMIAVNLSREMEDLRAA